MKVITNVIKTMYPNLTDKSVSVLENEINLVLVQDRVKEVLDNLWTRMELQRREALIKSFFNEIFKETEDNVRPADKVQTEQQEA